LSDFDRVQSPSWSPNGDLIAFAGSEEVSESKVNIFSGIPGLRRTLNQPWSLYVMDADESHIREVLSGIISPRHIKWSPISHSQIAFSGEYQNTWGLWIYDFGQQRLYLLWTSEADIFSYDWSQNGKQMIILDCKPYKNGIVDWRNSLCKPTIITLPEKLDEVD
jgi:Tol biopolymer transport system component